MAKLVSMMYKDIYKDLQECRMIYKLVANRIVVVNNSAIIFRVSMNFAILLLQLGYPLVPQNKTEEAKAEQINSLAIFFDPLLILSLCDISEGEKALFGWTKFQKILGDTFSKFRIVN